MNRVLVEEKTINRLVKKAVAETILDVLQDPDLGLELQMWVKKRLAKKTKGVISLEALQKKYL